MLLYLLWGRAVKTFSKSCFPDRKHQNCVTRAQRRLHRRYAPLRAARNSVVRIVVRVFVCSAYRMHQTTNTARSKRTAQHSILLLSDVCSKNVSFLEYQIFAASIDASKPRWVEYTDAATGTQLVENYLGHFLEKLQKKVWKKYKKLPQQQRGALRAPLLPAIVCTVSIFFVIFPRNGPGSFLQSEWVLQSILASRFKLSRKSDSCLSVR